MAVQQLWMLSNVFICCRECWIARRIPGAVDSLDNIRACLDLLQQLGVDVDGISPHDIHEGHTKPILSLFFGLSRFKQTHKQALKISAGFTIAPNALSPGTVPSISSSSSSLTTSNEKMVAADLLSPPTEIQSRLPTLTTGLARVSFLDRPGSTSSVPRRYSAHPVLLQDNSNPRSHHTLGHSGHVKNHSSNGHTATSGNNSLNRHQTSHQHPQHRISPAAFVVETPMPSPSSRHHSWQQELDSCSAPAVSD
ncbi:neuron navigator 3-like [Varroa jacobsoni]|uniref:neuron navigator 3-like n=1 Tax=Varroa jacobsoni TaxID=62625 RepID=UPI000BF56DB2|nr:neuron navigator 3-like [Varroa jacobsoni]